VPASTLTLHATPQAPAKQRTEDEELAVALALSMEQSRGGAPDSLPSSPVAPRNLPAAAADGAAPGGPDQASAAPPGAGAGPPAAAAPGWSWDGGESGAGPGGRGGEAGAGAQLAPAPLAHDGKVSRPAFVLRSQAV